MKIEFRSKPLGVVCVCAGELVGEGGGVDPDVAFVHYYSSTDLFRQSTIFCL